MKAIIGLLLIVAAIWQPFLIRRYLLPEGWQDAWYTVPLFGTVFGSAVVTALFGVALIAAWVEDDL